MQFRCIVFIIFLFIKITCLGQLDCVFADSSYTKDFLENSEIVVSYHWNDSSKEGSAILKNGGLLQIEKWACNHYGLSANILFSKNSEIPNNFKNYILDISKIINTNYAHHILEKKIHSINNIKEILNGEEYYELDLSDEVFPEYYVSFFALENCYVLSIFHYRN